MRATYAAQVANEQTARLASNDVAFEQARLREVREEIREMGSSNLHHPHVEEGFLGIHQLIRTENDGEDDDTEADTLSEAPTISGRNHIEEDGADRRMGTAPRHERRSRPSPLTLEDLVERRKEHARKRKEEIKAHNKKMDPSGIHRTMLSYFCCGRVSKLGGGL